MTFKLHYIICLVTFSLLMKEKESIRFYPYPIFRKAINCCFNNTVASRRTVITIDEGNVVDRSDGTFKGLPNLRSSNLKATEPVNDNLASGGKSFQASTFPPSLANADNVKISEDEKAYACSQLQCSAQEIGNPVCACNFKTGHTVTFKNECDLKKHNCRYDTVFKIILNEICPWQFESREDMPKNYDYSNPMYYN